MDDGRSGWNEMAATYDATRAFPGDGERDVPRAVADRLRAMGARRVLDLGCGTGRFALPLAREGIRVVGADRSPEMLAMLCAKRGRELLHVVRCDAERLPFRRAFDAVLISHFLHLVPSIEKLADELRRALLPGAHFVLVDTTSGPRPASLRVLAIVKPLLDGEWKPWPSGGDSRDGELFRELLGLLGDRDTGAVACGSYPHTTSLREVLDGVRTRKWWTFRARPEEVVARAADAAERRLAEEGADFDARVDEPTVVRLLVGRSI
jgi:SAM-dependent methyltransferase